MTNHPTAPSECEKPCICFDPENCTVVPPGFELRCKRLNKQPPSKTLPEYPSIPVPELTYCMACEFTAHGGQCAQCACVHAWKMIERERAFREWWERECRLRDERLSVALAKVRELIDNSLPDDDVGTAVWHVTDAWLKSTITQLPPLPEKTNGT